MPALSKSLSAALSGLLGLGLADVCRAQASGCTDLAAQPVTAGIDYYSQIQPIWDLRCANCHVNHGGNPAAGLDLDFEWSWLNLFEAGSAQVQGGVLAEPGLAAESYLFEKINCDGPEAGLRMPRGRTPLPAAEQALIRDWLNQGAREFPDPSLFRNGFEAAVAAPQQ